MARRPPVLDSVDTKQKNTPAKGSKDRLKTLAELAELEEASNQANRETTSEAFFQVDNAAVKRGDSLLTTIMTARKEREEYNMTELMLDVNNVL